MIMKV